MSLRAHRAAARILPFAVYILFLVVESVLRGEIDLRWLYAVQVGVVTALLAHFWPVYDELRAPSRAHARDWALGVGVGVAVFVLWINLDFPWARFGEGRGVAPDLTGGAALAGFAVRVLGVVVLVPVMEELFWRSFLMRWIEKPDFLAVAPAAVGWRALALSSIVFGVEHHLWLAGIVAGLAFGWLYRRTGHLWVVILAHAIANAALELWVVRTGNWQLL
jgi:CAAX prenyl protease-like protein